MAHTRTVFHTVHRPDGSVWEDFIVHFKLSPSAYTMHASLPESVVTATTNSAGYFEVDLETGVEFLVDMYSAFQIQGRTTTYGNRNIIKIVVPHGTAPIDLPTVMALQTEPDGDPDLAALANNHIGRKDNPHEVTAAQAGAYTTGEVDLLVSGVSGDVTAHTSDTGNPHSVTKAQVGLGNVANLAPADLPVSDATQDALDLKADDSALSAHTSDATNPHGVTKAQVGLGAVDNTSDANKPVSTATSNALALKADISSLGTAAAANVGDFATAAQGSLANTAVQPSGLVALQSDVTANTAARHTHSNKAALDTVTDAKLVPTGGLRGQVLTMGASGREWANAPSPLPMMVATPAITEDMSGPVTVTASAGVAVRDGAWWLCEGTVNLVANPRMASDTSGWGGTLVSRVASLPSPIPGSITTTGLKAEVASDGSYRALTVQYNRPVTVGFTYMMSAWVYISPGWVGTAPYMQAGGVGLAVGPDRVTIPLSGKGVWQRVIFPFTSLATTSSASAGFSSSETSIAGDYIIVTDVQWEAKGYTTPIAVGARVDGTIAIPHSSQPASILIQHRDASTGITQTDRLVLDGSNKAWFGRDNVGVVEWSSSTLIVRTTSMVINYARQIEVLGVATFDVVLPDYNGVIVTPYQWGMSRLNIGVIAPYPVLNTFSPTNKTASGTTNLRTAPGASTTLITALTAGSLVQDTGGRVTETGVVYARVIGPNNVGTGWVPASQLTAL